MQAGHKHLRGELHLLRPRELSRASSMLQIRVAKERGASSYMIGTASARRRSRTVAKDVEEEDT